MNRITLPQFALVNSVKLDSKQSVTPIVTKITSHPLTFTSNSTPIKSASLPSTNNYTLFPQNKEGWDILFTKAKQAKTLQEKELFRIYLTSDVASKLPCGACSQHTKNYLSSHDIKEYYYLTETIDGVRQDIGLFKYIWEFKNSVNKRLGKQSISFIDAYRMYATR